MKTLILIFIPALILAPVTVFGASLLLGEGGTVSYDTTHDTDGGVLYYENDLLVASAHDTDGDSTHDFWLTYSNDIAILEAHDTDGDGTPDAFFELDTDERVIREYGSGIETYERPDVVSFDERITAEQEESDLVGDLSSITIPGGGLGWFTWIVLLGILTGVGYWWFKRRA